MFLKHWHHLYKLTGEDRIHRFGLEESQEKTSAEGDRGRNKKEKWQIRSDGKMRWGKTDGNKREKHKAQNAK